MSALNTVKTRQELSNKSIKKKESNDTPMIYCYEKFSDDKKRDSARSTKYYAKCYKKMWYAAAMILDQFSLIKPWFIEF